MYSSIALLTEILKDFSHFKLQEMRCIDANFRAQEEPHGSTFTTTRSQTIELQNQEYKSRDPFPPFSENQFSKYWTQVHPLTR